MREAEKMAGKSERHMQEELHLGNVRRFALRMRGEPLMRFKSRPETPKLAQNNEADVRDQSDSGDRDVWLAQIVESCGDAVVGATLDGVIVSWNRGAARIFGYSEEEAVGCPLSLVLPSVHGTDLVHLIEHVATDRRTSPGETICLRKDGREMSVLISISPIRSPDAPICVRNLG